jgi:hypothetical protein
MPWVEVQSSSFSSPWHANPSSVDVLPQLLEFAFFSNGLHLQRIGAPGTLKLSLHRAQVVCCRNLSFEELGFSMDRSALLSECRMKFASKSAADVQAAISLLDSHDLKEDPSVSTIYPYSWILFLSYHKSFG